MMMSITKISYSRAGIWSGSEQATGDSRVDSIVMEGNVYAIYVGVLNHH